MANSLEIQQKIVHYLQTLSNDQIHAAKLLLKRNMRACFSGKLNSDEPEPRGSRLGGSPFLPFEVDHPREKRGTPMRFILQINFAELPKLTERNLPDQVLAVFGNSDNDYNNAKDKNAFRCVQITHPSEKTFLQSSFPEASISPQAKSISFTPGWNLPRYKADWKETHGITDDIITKLSEIANSEEIPNLQIFGHSLNASCNELREIAAFAANGISWSEARSKDSCYSHLVDNAASWIPLVQIPDSFISGKMLTLLITEEALNNGDLDKSWLLLV